MSLSRRRFLTITAAVTLAPASLRAQPGRHWVGQALGARASIRIDHPEAPAITARCLAEIERLEGILSLYRPESALSRLNRDAVLEAPPFELLECLSLAGAVHRASGGRFDPTVQPLWALWAEAAAAGRRPAPDERRAALARTGWDRVRLDAARITLEPGMALTLNGIGQGYVADRVAAVLEAEGLGEILIDTGELRALGGRPDGSDWPVRLAAGGAVGLRGRALATSAPLGTSFDAAGRDGHILDPLSGAPARPAWRAVSISAPGAALADALSTAACLAEDRPQILALLAGFDGARLESLHRGA
ncbi:FAD:protein FMN transferase [Paracoccus sp. P2]|uniref:FAD:protein FMN transferase n=1 Tax=Paracoccus pantotrophus TaxID=82367 RepID=A0A7H9BQ24_PARPN|nr:FAD:protein FMN transferase [Paracoccus pantotrophus]MDF3853897.1 FAD:protein FMN transferase [Paracoccus pantotrophus]QLH13437.1 FAD:protein FMN transferase [Paracoccus pantotrophus]RDD96775.1 FAD:protein FMN transferase [Paracoccus pantotrophus]RNI16650.1 FAD:protein FMN transferase [Paracoccus pantotrophus]WGR67348.1 FAD:protein FMN transferase [Paracoccus pantotrophus]